MTHLIFFLYQMDLIFLMDCKVSATRAPIPMVHHLQLKNLCLLASSISKVPGQFLVLFFVSPFKRRNFFLRHHLLSGTPQALVFHELWGVVKQHLKLCHERWRFSQLFSQAFSKYEEMVEKVTRRVVNFRSVS